MRYSYSENQILARRASAVQYCFRGNSRLIPEIRLLMGGSRIIWLRFSSVCPHPGWRKTSLMRNVSHDIKTQLRQQGSSDPCFCVCNFNQHCCAGESSAWSRGCEKSAELRLESGFSSADRWQVCGDHRTAPALRRLAASRAPSLNSGHSVLRGLTLADFDNSERRTGADPRVQCDVGFESDFSQPSRSVVDPRQGVGI
jgi:hypothetical protein